MRLFEGFLPETVVAFVSERAIDFRRRENFGGFSAQQREYLSPWTQGFPGVAIQARQVHADRIVILPQAVELPLSEEADGLMTVLPDLPLAVRTADCLSVFMFAADKNVIALLHAGWRGSQAGIISKAVVMMQDEWGVNVRFLKVGFGPCIRACCYQVGAEFRNHFPGETAIRGGNFYLDLAAVNKNKLFQQGILPEQIADCAICTCCDFRFFSHRREGEAAGRMISLLARKG